MGDIERLTNDKAELVTRLQCCEEELMTANECENCVTIKFHLLSFQY